MTLPSSFSVDYMGSAKLDVPIEVPPGTAGMSPHLSLSYSSSGGNGYVGVGWSLSGIMAITRCPWTIATNSSAEPVTFTNGYAGATVGYDKFCLQGQPMVQSQQQSSAGQQTAQGQQYLPGQQLVLPPHSPYYYGQDQAAYTTEIEGFNRIVSHSPANYNGPSSFTVYMRSGLIYEFGATSNAIGLTNAQVLCTQPANCTANTTVMTWMLDKITDTVGNTVNISYVQNGARAYPQTILYSTNTVSSQTLSGTNKVTFGYATSRPDAPIQFLGGQQTQTAWLLNSIVTAVYTNNAWSNVSTYALCYGPTTNNVCSNSSGSLTGRSRLQTVTRTGYNSSTLLPTTFTYCDLCGAPADLLSSFNNGLDKGTSIAYALTTHAAYYTPNTTLATYPSQNLTTPRYIVTSVSADNGINGTYNVDYSYGYGLNDLSGRGFLGFNQVKSTDQQTHLVKNITYSQAYPTIGAVLIEATVYAPSKESAVTIKAVSNSYDYPASYNLGTYPHISSTVTTGADLNGLPLPTTYESFSSTNPNTGTASPDLYGNNTYVTTVLDQNDNNGPTNTTYTTIGVYQFQNDTVGWNSTNGYNWIIDRLTSAQVTKYFTDNLHSGNSSTPTTRTTSYLVDQNTGFTSQQTVQPGPGTGTGAGFTDTTTYTYDSFGNKHIATSVGDYPGGILETRTTTWTYGSSNDPGAEFPDSIQNTLLQTETRQYDTRWGLPLSITDIDGRTTQYAYDDLGRATQIKPQDGSTKTITYLFCSGVNGGTFSCPANPNPVYPNAVYLINTTDVGADGSNSLSPPTQEYYDNLDRDIEEDTLNFDGQSINRLVRTYDTQLQLNSVSRPFIGNTPQNTIFAYDALNRVTQTNYPDGSSDTIAYNQLEKVFTLGIGGTSPAQNSTKLYDGHGNEISTIQYVTLAGNSSPTTVTTTHLYDGFDNLVKITDGAGNVTAYTYDVLGRKIGVSDPDAGTRTQTYTPFDELESILDTRNTYTWMVYDGLGRMTSRCWTASGAPQGDQQSCANPSQTEVLEKWSYDPTNGIGELGAESSTDGSGTSASHTYNGAGGLLGQPMASTLMIGNKSFLYTYGYDADYRPNSYVSPSGAQPVKVWTSNGYLSELLDGPGGPIMWQAITLDAEDHVTSSTTAESAFDRSYGFSATTGRLTSEGTTFGNSGPSLQNIAYTWDQFGNLKQRNDATNSLVENYNYDELFRLLSITLGSGSTENSFTYDILGNMLTKGDVGTYTYPPAGSPQPHGVSSVQTSSGPVGFSYDSNGNVVDVGSLLVSAQSGALVRHINANIFNMTKTVTYSSNSLQFQYDADHNRSLETASEGKTYYLPDGELTPSVGSGPVWHTYFEVDGARVAEDYGPTGALLHHYFINDYQNSIGLVTTDGYVYGGAGTAQNEGSDVFGQPRLPSGAADPTWNANGATKRRYINQEDLTDVHLIDLNARLYDPLFAKFLAPDPVITDQDDSQAWNAYAYSHNNPMSKEDPTGKDPNSAQQSLDALENTTAGPLGMGNSGGGGFLIATNGHQSAVISTAQSIQFAAAGASFSPEAANQTIQSIGDKGGPGGQALADAEKGLSQLNVKLPDGSSYTPMSHVKNDVQAKLFGQKKGTPIPFMVAPGVDPEQLVNDWAGKRGSSWNFASYWWPGGRHDYKQTPRIGPMLDGFGNFMYGATGAAAGYSRDQLQGMGQAIKWGKNDPVNVQDIDTGFDAINRGGQLFAYPPSR